MASVYREAASRLSLSAPLAVSVAEVFRNIGSRPVVGVHLRRGDFPLLADEFYDLHQALLSAVPIWWYEWVMQAIVKRQPATCFLLCCSGAPEAAATLRKHFDIVEIPITNPYKKSAGHCSAHHPVADLFALACCPVILATPVSSFSHYAANVLGRESACLVPPPQMTKRHPKVARVRAYRQLLNHWIDACLSDGLETLSPDLNELEMERPACHDWLQVR